jgi:hypothetical protein
MDHQVATGPRLERKPARQPTQRRFSASASSNWMMIMRGGYCPQGLAASRKPASVAKVPSRGVETPFFSVEADNNFQRRRFCLTRSKYLDGLEAMNSRRAAISNFHRTIMMHGHRLCPLVSWRWNAFGCEALLTSCSVSVCGRNGAARHTSGLVSSLAT